MTPQLLSVCLTVALFLALCVASACWIVAVEAERDRAEAEEQREADAKDLRRVKLALTHYIERTYRAETVVADLLMEQAEDDAKAEALSLDGVNRFARDLAASLERARGPVKLSPEEAERVMRVLFPTAKRTAVTQ